METVPGHPPLGRQDRRTYSRNPTQALCLILTQSLPAVGLENFLFSAQRRRDAKKLEKTSATYLKQAGFSLIYFLFGAKRRRGAKKLEKPLAAWRLCESKFFFLTNAKSQPAVGRLGVN
jgi:hypothetical protein